MLAEDSSPSGGRCYGEEMATKAGAGAFARATRAAARLLGRNPAIERLIGAAGLLLQKRGRRFAGLKTDLLALLRMLRAFVTGRYRRVPQRTLLAALAGLVYFVNPLDLVPDALPLLGFVDDVGVLAWIVHKVRQDIEAYVAWEREWGSTIDVEGRVEPEGRPAHPPTQPALPAHAPSQACPPTPPPSGAHPPAPPAPKP